MRLVARLTRSITEMSIGKDFHKLLADLLMDLRIFF